MTGLLSNTLHIAYIKAVIFFCDKSYGKVTKSGSEWASGPTRLDSTQAPAGAPKIKIARRHFAGTLVT